MSSEQSSLILSAHTGTFFDGGGSGGTTVIGGGDGRRGSGGRGEIDLLLENNCTAISADTFINVC